MDQDVALNAVALLLLERQCLTKNFRNGLNPGTLYLYISVNCGVSINAIIRTLLAAAVKQIKPPLIARFDCKWPNLKQSTWPQHGCPPVDPISKIRLTHKRHWHSSLYQLLCSETTKQLAVSHICLCIDNSSPSTQLHLHTIRQDSCCACPLLTKQLFNLEILLTSQYKSIHLDEVLTAPLPDTGVDLRNSRRS